MTDGLSGVRVVDFGHFIAGPLAALLLADAGAEVVHVDPPGAPPELAVADAYLNRGKRRVTLDLKREADLTLARGLVEQADVLIENFRPGVMDRLGLGYDAVPHCHSRLIYCSIPGFGATDPNASTAAWEGVVHAAVAGYRPLNEHWDPSGRNKARVDDPSAPLYTPITTASNFGGLLGATAIVMALIARERMGHGQRVEIPLVEAFAEAYSTMLGHRVYADAKMGDNLMLGDLTYRCADGGMIDCSPYPKFIIPLLEAAGVADEWQRLGLIDRADRSFSLEQRDRILDKFSELVRAHPAAWWDELATEINVPVSMVRTPAEWLTASQAHESEAVVTLDDPFTGPTRLPGRGFDLGASPGHSHPRHRPDEDRASIVAELGAASRRVACRARRGMNVSLVHWRATR